MSELPKANQVHPAPPEVSIGSHQEIGKGKKVETLQGKGKGKDKKDSSKPVEKASDTAISQPEQDTDPGAPKAKSLGLGFYLL